MNRFAIFDKAGHIISEKGKFNRFISYCNTLNAIIFSYLYSWGLQSYHKQVGRESLPLLLPYLAQKVLL